MNKPRIAVYTSDSPITHPTRLLRDMFRDLSAGRELAWQLAVRDIRAKYRQAALGLIWAFIVPLAHALTWIFLNRSGIVTVGDTAQPYPLYVFTGTMLWAIFADAVNAPLQQTTSAKQILAKTSFPREALVISGIYQSFFNAAIKIIMLFLVLMLFKKYPSWTVVWFPLGTLSLILAGTALGLLITPMGILYTDIGKSLPIMMNFLMYITPVVFPMPTHGWAEAIFKFNPMTPLILTTRDWLTATPPDHLGYFYLVTALTLLLLIFVWILYRTAMPILIERMSS